MFIEIENLGPIKKGRIKLKPLTVFIGPNNTGKTYLAYLISGLCEDRHIRRYIFALIRRKRKPVYTLSEKDINDILEKGQIEIKINLKDILTENFEYIVSILRRLSGEHLPTEKFAKNFWKFLGSDKKELFSDLSITVKVPKVDSFEIGNMIHNRAGYIRSATLFGHTILRAIAFKNTNSHQVYIKLWSSTWQRIHENKQDVGGITSDQINQFLSRVILSLLVGIALQPIIISDVFIFPAQRNSLVLDFIRSAINIASREEESPDEELPDSVVISHPERLIRSKPILDFLRMTDLISEDIRSHHYDLGLKLEEVLGGRVTISVNSKGEREIRFVIDEKKNLKLVTTSSMVQQLSSLALYLKHQAEPGDLIVIDEPESNLHPEAQTKITEIIAEMVNRGLWVIITTHSPFILEHINNLMKAYVVANISDETRESVLDIFEDENVLLNPEKVGVYLFTREGTIEDVKKDYIVDAESFRKVSDELGAKFTELLIIEDLYKKTVGENNETTV